MGVLTSLGILLLVPAAPLPLTPPVTEAEVDRNQALLFAGRVVQLAAQVSEMYVRPVSVPQLLDAAVRGLYEEAGQACPESVRETLRAARTTTQSSEALAEARIALGDRESLRGPRALFAAVNGFRHATDAYTGLMTPRITSFVSIDTDFGLGLELENVSGPRWTLYQLELGYATGRFPADPAIGPVAMPTPPASFPWRVRRIIPGSPCQRAGLRPGDVITHMNDTPLTAESSPKLFRELLGGPIPFDTPAAQVRPPQAPQRTFRIRREGQPEPLTLTVAANGYSPETVFGVRRIADDAWNHMLDREHGIGYLRLGAIERDTDAKMADVLASLNARKCRALILDLRWCPGGYVDSCGHIAGSFLDEGTVITKMTSRSGTRTGEPPDLRVQTPAGWAKFADRPVVVLVGPDTSGGGEMIAGALQDHGRAVVIGQRTVGKGNVQVPFASHIGDLQFKVSTGYSLRPNGKSRHRFPDSKPTDDWGIRPDVGFEIPLTADALAALRRTAELHTLRPAGSREALDFDDPARDPYRMLALRTLRKKLAPRGNVESRR